MISSFFSISFSKSFVLVGSPFNASFADCSFSFAAFISACVTFSFANTAFASSTALSYAACLSDFAL